MIFLILREFRLGKQITRRQVIVNIYIVGSENFSSTNLSSFPTKNNFQIFRRIEFWITIFKVQLSPNFVGHAKRSFLHMAHCVALNLFWCFDLMLLFFETVVYFMIHILIWCIQHIARLYYNLWTIVYVI